MHLKPGHIQPDKLVRLQAIEMWFLLGILGRIKMDRIRNDKIREMLNIE